MNQIQTRLVQLVEEAVRKFNENEKYLIETDLSERCICSKFAMYLASEIEKSEYRDYHVDVEYNRGACGDELHVKCIEDKRIVVDLIVHKRGFDPVFGFDNLICIEMKKSTDRRGCDTDEVRLQKMTSYSYGFNYKIGVMLLVNMKKERIEVNKIFKL